jgi:glyoxylase-like metal-dependent hydrolase (beta-lactamase superfamily II)
VTLEPGDVLVAFTDGISEAMNLADEEWGDDRLMDAVRSNLQAPARDLIDRIVNAADAFVAGAPQHGLQPPSVVFGDFMAIDDGERRLELRRVGPAHTIGDAVAFLPKEGILFTGDLCVNWRFGNNVGDRDADHPHWVQVLNEMAGWNVKTVVPGHGGLGTVATLRAQSEFIDDLWKQVSAGKKRGKTADQLVKEIDWISAKVVAGRETTHASINDNIGAANDPVTKELFAFVAEALKR